MSLSRVEFYVLTLFKKITANTFSSLMLGASVFCYSNTLYAVDAEIYEEALIQFHQGEYTTAIIHLNNLLGEDPLHLPSRVLLAENYLALGDGIAAEVELNKAKQGGAAFKLISPLMAKSYLIQSKYDELIALPIVNDGNPSYESIMLTYQGLAYLAKANYEQARFSLTQALNLNASNVDAMLGKAKLAIKVSQPKFALENVHQALAIEPNNSHALVLASIISKQLNDNPSAYSYINQSLKHVPDNYTALLIRAVLEMEMKNPQAAIEDVDKIISALPNEPVANYIKLLSSQEVDDQVTSDKLKVHLGAVMGAIPKEVLEAQPIYYFLQGLVSLQSGAIEAASKSLLKYHQVHPNDIRTLKLLAQIDMQLGKSFSARKYLVKAHLIDENDPQLWTMLGRSNMLTGSLDKAEFYFDKVNKVFPNNLSAKVDLAKLYL